MKQYIFYILECSDKSYYTGVTNNLERRMYEHKEGINKSSYTYKRRPLKLKFYYVFNDINQAIGFEKQVKGWTRKKKEALFNENWDEIVKLAECKNKSHFKNYNK